MAHLNCMNEPYVIELKKQKVILRYQCSARKNDFGTMTLEDAEN